MTELFDKIKEITELDGIAGYEHKIRDFLGQKMTPFVDEVETDGLGGLFGIKHSKLERAPRVMVAAHMDEVGFMVSDIKEDGTLRAVAIGGWNPLVISSQRFTLYTRTEQAIPVISGSVPPHFLRGNNGGASLPKVEDIVFDGGFADKTEAESFGITPGDIIIPKSEAILTANQKNVISKAWDNRYGVLMVTELLQSLKNEQLDPSLLVLMFKKKLVFVVLRFQQLNSSQIFFWQLTAHLLVMSMTIKVKLVRVLSFAFTIRVMSCLKTCVTFC